jgi:putative redox protein
MPKPPIETTLTWTHDLAFTATSGPITLTIDGNTKEGASPVQALAMALAGCMAVDVVDIVVKGRHPLTGLTATLVAQRAEEPPRRFTHVTLRFLVTGAVPTGAVERAVQLSHEKYCSVWHSLRQDIPFDVTFAIQP